MAYCRTWGKWRTRLAKGLLQDVGKWRTRLAKGVLQDGGRWRTRRGEQKDVPGGCELHDGTFDLASGGVDIADAVPVIVAHLQLPADDHAHPDAQPVTQQHVQHDSVPPTLRKCRQYRRERQLEQTKTILNSLRKVSLNLRSLNEIRKQSFDQNGKVEKKTAEMLTEGRTRPALYIRSLGIN